MMMDGMGGMVWGVFSFLLGLLLIFLFVVNGCRCREMAVGSEPAFSNAKSGDWTRHSQETLCERKDQQG